MGIFDFIKNIGRELTGNEKPDEEIRESIEKELGDQIQNLRVEFSDGTVRLHGTAKSQAAKEKAVLLAGNVKEVERVDDSSLEAPEFAKTDAASEPNFYTIQKGDSLSKIAQREYGDAQMWNALFDANREVIKDPDLIYPGQRIRIPEL